MTCRETFVKRCEARLKEIGPEGRAKLHHGSTDPEDWDSGLRYYWDAVIDCLIEDWGSNGTAV